MNADELFQRAGQLMQAGRAPQAAALLQQAVNVDPQHYLALCALAQIATGSQRMDIAEHFAERAVRAKPEGFEALALLASAAQANGKIDVALDATRSIAELRPDDDRVQFNLGVLHEQKRDVEAARTAYRQAIDLNPDHIDARANLAMLELPIDAEATVQQITEIVRRKRGTSDTPIENQPALPDSESITSAFKIRMDLEQLRYLAAHDLLAQEVRHVADALAQVLDDVRDEDDLAELPVRHPRHHWKSHWQTMAAYHNRPLYLPVISMPDGPLINPDLDRAAIERQYFDSQPQHVVVDDLLAPEALARLLEFCRFATIWFDVRRNYLGAYLTEGFGNALTIGIAQALADALPNLFGNHPLTQAWGYKYGPALSGIGMHADAAAINCNFWIAPDDANLDPGSGGLRIFRKQAPLEWDFDTFNNDEAAMRQHLGASLHDPIVVPHRQNRMVIFNSNLIHQTDTIRFRDAFADRRYNITLLYGRRGHP